jgi:hypothetical protein
VGEGLTTRVGVGVYVMISVVFKMFYVRSPSLIYSNIYCT